MKLLVAIFILVVTINSLSAQTPLWQGNGRIAISSDGNEHDFDDWSATALSLSLLSAEGLQDNLVLYTYSDHVWRSNQEIPLSAKGLTPYEEMRESALEGQEWFGFRNTKFVCAVDNAEVAHNAMRDVINKSTSENPLIIIAAGPMQVVGEAINRADVSKRQYVTIVTHSIWNNVHSDHPYENTIWDKHSGWTFQKIIGNFSNPNGGNLKCIQIKDQNGGANYEGLMAPIESFDWIKTSHARYNPAYKLGAWDWLYSRMEVCIKDNGKSYDPSDAGMIIYILTGIEETDPNMAREIMENPVKKE